MSHSLVDSAMRAINTAGMTDLETTVFKATYPDDNKSKEKHVDALLRMCNHYKTDHIVRLLGARIRERDWAVSLKALSVCHRLQRDANIRFFTTCTTLPVFSGLGDFLDERTTNAWGQSRFIREYANYLEEKTNTFKALGRSIELLPAKDGGEWIKTLKFAKLKETVPKLQSQFGKLLKCDPYTDEGGIHEVAVMGMLQLIKDGFRVYSVLTISIFQQLNKWKSMTKREGLFFLECYEKFVSQTKLFKAWALKMVKCGLVDKEVLPDFDNLPENIIPTLDKFFRKDKGGKDDVSEEEEEEEPTPGDEEEEEEEEEETPRPIKKNMKGKKPTPGDEEEEEEEEEETARPIKKNMKGKKAPVKKYESEEEEEEETPKEKSKKSSSTPVRRQVSDLDFLGLAIAPKVASKQNVRPSQPDSDDEDEEEVVETGNRKTSSQPAKKPAKKVESDDEEETPQPAKKSSAKPAKKAAKNEVEEPAVKKSSAKAAAKKVEEAPSKPAKKIIRKVIEVEVTDSEEESEEEEPVKPSKAVAKAATKASKKPSNDLDIDELYSKPSKPKASAIDEDNPFDAPSSSKKPSKKAPVKEETTPGDDLDLL